MKKECLLEYEQYIEEVNPFEIYKMEELELQKQQAFVLSAFPEFLVDYFGVKLWKTCVKHTWNSIEQQCKE